jgi:membrane protease YdiL (CAAX protease family)
MAVFTFGTLLLLAFLAFATWRTARFLRAVALTTNLLLLPVENLMRLALVLACIVLARVSGLPYAQFGWSAAQPEQFALIGLIVGSAAAVVVPLLTRCAVARFGASVYSPIVVQSIMPRRRREWLLVPLALALAVLLEELLFRSLLLGGFGTLAPPGLLAIVGSIIFGALHLPQGALGIVVAAALGVLLSALFLATQNLIAPLVAHYLINLAQLAWAAQDRFWESYDTGSHS